ncbi:hypothetical protein ACTID9_06705 [Brevibacillus fluminis]
MKNKAIASPFWWRGFCFFAVYPYNLAGVKEVEQADEYQKAKQHHKSIADVEQQFFAVKRIQDAPPESGINWI